jgi:hypothetical protein
MKNLYEILVGKPERDLSEDPCAVGRIIFEWILKK